MTRVRLPPDPENSCITTIVDSQGGDAALMSAVAAMNHQIHHHSATSSTRSSPPSILMTSTSAGTSSAGSPTSAGGLNGTGGIENVDSIILVYDLDREETFFRMENHWLPLIERCYNGGVSVVPFLFYLSTQRRSFSLRPLQYSLCRFVLFCLFETYKIY